MRAGTPVVCPDCAGIGTSQPELLEFSIRGRACTRCHGNGQIMDWWVCEKCGGSIQENDLYADIFICGKCRNYDTDADDAFDHMTNHI